MKKGIVGVLSFALGTGLGAAVTGKTMGDKVDSWKNMSDKHLELFLMMNQWVKVKQEGKSLKDYFERNDFKTIAIYGMSYAGETLVDELIGSDITIKYGIDKCADKIYSNLDIVTMESELEEVDAVIVTPITFFEEIQKNLEEKLDCPIISLEDVLYEV